MEDIAKAHDEAVHQLDPTTNALYGFLLRRWESRDINPEAPTMATAYTAEILDAVPTLTRGALDAALANLERPSLVIIDTRLERGDTSEIEAIEYEVPLWATIKAKA